MLKRHDMTQPLPQRHGPLRLLIHAAGIASPMYYRACRSKAWTPTSTACATCSSYALAEREGSRSTVLFYCCSEIYGRPAPDCDPDAGDLRGNVSCTGPRACYDESKRYGETLCVVFARQYGLPVPWRGHSTTTARASRSPTAA